MVSFADTRSSGKRPAHRLLDKAAIEQICTGQGLCFRQCKLPPGRTVQCFAWQILMGNATLDEVAHWQNMDFSGPAFCQARQRLPEAVLQELSDRLAKEVLAAAGARANDDGCFHGKRVFRIDGSSASLPDAPEIRRHFGCSGVQK